MEEVERQILTYHDLDPAQREQLEQFVDGRPEWQALLRDVKALEALASEARLLHGEEGSDAVLAYYVVGEYLGQRSSSARMQERLSEVEYRLQTDADLQAQYDTFRQRLEAALEAVDPAEQFERLSGYDLSTLSLSEEPEPAKEALPKTQPQSSWLDWLGVMPRAFQWAMATVFIVAIGYGALFAVSEWGQTEIDELAAIQPSEMQVEGYTLRLRGADPAAAESPDALYRQALAVLRGARVSTLGLFPHYDAEALKRAETLLVQVVDREEAGSFLQLEAHYFLGKIRLAQDSTEDARGHFKTVVEGEGGKAREAAIILEELQRIAPSQKGAESYFGPDNRLPTGSDAPDA